MDDKLMVIPFSEIELTLNDNFDFGHGFKIVKRLFDLKNHIKTFEGGFQYKELKISSNSIVLKSPYWLISNYESTSESSGKDDGNQFILMKVLIMLFRILYASILHEKVMLTFKVNNGKYYIERYYGSRSRVSIHIGPAGYVYDYTEEHLERIKILFDNYIKNLKNETDKSNSILRAITFFKFASESELIITKFINNSIALECIYSTDHKELTYRLSHRVALFLGELGKDRKEIFNKISEIYKHRGKLVHGDKLTEKMSGKFYEVSNNLELFIRHSLTKILEDDKFIKLFSSNKTINKYFEEKILG